MSVLEIFAIILAVLGIIGAVIPALPGPPLSWVGLLLLYFDKPDAAATGVSDAAGSSSAAIDASAVMDASAAAIDAGAAASAVSLTQLLVWLVVVTAVTVVDYVVPAAMTRAAGGHKAASVGAVIGLFAGIFLTPIGMIAGSLLGAFLGELMVADRGAWAAFKASLGAFAGFMLGTVAKLIVCGWILWDIIAAVV